MVLLHKSLADIRPNGPKRSEPNQHPYLPPPARMKFTLNPCVAVYSLLGPKLCRQLGCVLCIVLAVLLAYYMIPVILGDGIYDLFVDFFDDIF